MKRMTMVGLGIGALIITGLGSGCSTGSGQEGTTDRITIGAYSVVREAFHDGLLPAFAAHWKSKTGKDVEFEESYNASGAQARAIAAGFDADIAVLSLDDDMEILVKAGRVKPEWNSGPNKGFLTNSLVVIGYREGNPKGIKDWADLTKPGVGVLYPDPKTSGGARWNINAIYGSAQLASKEAHGGTPDPAEVRDFLAKVQANVVNMDASARQSMANFTERGIGDAIVSYENELLLQRKQGKEIPFVVPPATLLIESPIALVESSVERHKNREVVEAFHAFLLGPEGQRILADYGFRPVNPEVASATAGPLPPKLFTMKDLGGWAKIKDEVYGPKGIWTSIFTQGLQKK